jgi:hypothetical protein
VTVPTRLATPSTMLLKVPNGPPHPDHVATMIARMRGTRDEYVAVAFDAEEAATFGRKLLDWASRADPVTAVNAVGVVLRESGR